MQVGISHAMLSVLVTHRAGSAAMGGRAKPRVGAFVRTEQADLGAAISLRQRCLGSAGECGGLDR